MTNGRVLALVAAACAGRQLVVADNDPQCSSLLFAFFETEELYYAISDDGLRWDVLNGNKPVLNTTVPNTSIRDPYLAASADGSQYFLVSTDGQGFGANPNILTWATRDLVHFGPQHVAPVMDPRQWPGSSVADTWAPEFAVADAGAPAPYFVFWAARGKNLLPAAPSTGPCNNSDAARFAFFGAWTSDFIAFSKPAVFFDPGCNVTTPVGDGGIDGDLVRDENGAWVLAYKDARGAGESVRGVRFARSSSGRVDGPYLDSTVTALQSPTLVEGPELVRFNGAWNLYYDCSFVKTPPGWPRPPYGISTSPSLAAPAFAELPGACTGSAPATMAFPKGATHGSFLCVNASTAAVLRAAFP